PGVPVRARKLRRAGWLRALPGVLSASRHRVRSTTVSSWRTHTAHIVDSDREAVARATADFSEACRVDDASGSIEAMGRQLSARGYVIVENFKVVDEDAYLLYSAAGALLRR